MQVCSGLVYLHSMDFLHKNIRTSNILLTRNFDAKIAGFGSDDIDVDPSRMAPELRSDPSKHSAESDIYALGVVMELMGEGSKDYMRWMAMVTKDEVKAQEYFMKAANLGDREAQYNVGVYYLHQKDYVVAENWFRKAAKQGFLEAWSALGDLLRERHRYADALENYKYAASAGDAHSQYWLGEMYYRGDTLQENSFTFKESYQRHTIEDDTWFEKFSRGRSIQDDTLAYKWFLEAANQGHADAAYSVGYMHQYGRGANQSYEEAEKWYLAAIDKGNVPAQRSLQRMRCNRAIELAMMSVAEEELSYDEITLVLRNQSAVHNMIYSILANSRGPNTGIATFM
ncbi:hypothetical protein BGZ88_004707 [Linnemannia elongata]|nr:hypothetical protein BGZ88_004707 [Linnemannia elongata]